MLACVKPTSAVGSSAVLYVPTPHPLPPLHPLPLFCVGFGYVYFTWQPIFLFLFVLYLCVFVLESYLSCWSMCFSNNREYESWGCPVYMSGTNNVFSKKSNFMILIKKKTCNFLCKMKWIRVSINEQLGLKQGQGLKGSAVHLYLNFPWVLPHLPWENPTTKMPGG